MTAAIPRLTPGANAPPAAHPPRSPDQNSETQPRASAQPSPHPAPTGRYPSVHPWDKPPPPENRCSKPACNAPFPPAAPQHHRRLAVIHGRPRRPVSPVPIPRQSPAPHAPSSDSGESCTPHSATAEASHSAQTPPPSPPPYPHPAQKPSGTTTPAALRYSASSHSASAAKLQPHPQQQTRSSPYPLLTKPATHSIYAGQ